jgi:hypothetical protein
MGLGDNAAFSGEIITYAMSGEHFTDVIRSEGWKALVVTLCLMWSDRFGFFFLGNLRVLEGAEMYFNFCLAVMLV